MSTPADDATRAAAELIDCDSVYRGEYYFGDLTPWDIGAPQPAVVGLEEAGLIEGNVLDAGCGLGDNAIFLSGRGYQVIAFDASPTAIGRARQRAEERSAPVDFRVADATALPDFGDPFDTIVDSALYHCLGLPERRRYVARLHQLCKPGARLHILCLSDTRPQNVQTSRHVSEAELREVLADAWNITALRLTSYVTSFTTTDVGRNVVAFGGDEGAAPTTFQFDDAGRFLAPAWLVTGVRR